MSDELLPDLSWIKACNEALLEEAELLLAELSAKFDIGETQPQVKARRELPTHKQPQVGGPDPYGALRSNALLMLRNREVIEAFGQVGSSRWAVKADETIVRRVLAVIRNPALLDPPTPRPQPRELDLSWIDEFDRRLLDCLRDILKEIKRNQDLDLEAQVVRISLLWKTAYDLLPHPDDQERMTAERMKLLKTLQQRGIVKAFEVRGRVNQGGGIWVEADRKAVAGTIRAIDDLFRGRWSKVQEQSSSAPVLAEGTPARPEPAPSQTAPIINVNVTQNQSAVTQPEDTEKKAVRDERARFPFKLFWVLFAALLAGATPLACQHFGLGKKSPPHGITSDTASHVKK